MAAISAATRTDVFCGADTPYLFLALIGINFFSV